MVELRLPNITAKNTEGQMVQMQSYMHQLVQELNWALSTVDSAMQGNTSNIVINGGKNGGKADITPEEAENTFNSIKALIIKSADIVKAYEETMKETFNGSYIAQSDFGTYLQNTQLTVETDSKTIAEYFTNVQQITDALNEDVNEIKEADAYIKRGLLDYDDNGDPITGIEIGETTEDGVFNKCARFTADNLEFYHNSDKKNPVAYIGARCLYINGKAQFFGDIQINHYYLDTSDGLAFTWIE